MLSDLVGKRFGRLTVGRYYGVRITRGGQRKTRWLCKCDCGKSLAIDTQGLTSGRTKSCGCLARELATQRFRTHGMSRTKEWRAWLHAKGRCYDRNDSRYRIYGARGVKMCKEWRNDFAQFLRDMGRSPLGMTLERVDNSKGYEPKNCVWASRLQQANNKRTNSIVELYGKRMTLSECSRMFRVSYKSLHHFYHTKNYPIRDAIKLATSTLMSAM